MPWEPELFSAGALERVANRHRRERLALVPFFVGLMTGEIDAIIASFAGEPELHHPIRGRVRGAAAFERFAAETARWLTERNVTVEDVDWVLTPQRGVEEVVLHVDGAGGGVALPAAVATDHDERGHIFELRAYFSPRALTGARAGRPPLIQPPGEL